MRPKTTRTITKQEQALAKRMGVKDTSPEGLQKSKERFFHRQETGESKLGAVANYIPDEELS